MNRNAWLDWIDRHCILIMRPTTFFYRNKKFDFIFLFDLYQHKSCLTKKNITDSKADVVSKRSVHLVLVKIFSDAQIASLVVHLPGQDGSVAGIIKSVVRTTNKLDARLF